MHWIKTVTSVGGDIEKLCFDFKRCLKTRKKLFLVDPEKAGDPVYWHCRQDSWVSLLNMTASQKNPSYESGKGMKVKVVTSEHTASLSPEIQINQNWSYWHYHVQHFSTGINVLPVMSIIEHFQKPSTLWFDIDVHCSYMSNSK